MRRFVAAAGLGTVLSLILAGGSVVAFPLDGCTMSLQARDASGATGDTAQGPGQGDTPDDPFVVTWGGQVGYSGTTGSQVIKNHHWGVAIYNLPLFSGGDPNSAENTTAEGTVLVRLPDGIPDFLRSVGLFHVSGAIDGEGGTHCDGSGWVRITGVSEFTTIPFWVAVVAIVVGALLLATSLPGRKPSENGA